MHPVIKRIAAAVLAMLMLLSLCSCGIAGGPLKIGIVLPTKEEEWWLDIEKGFLKAIEEEGFDAEIMFSQGSSATERLNVDTLLTRGIEVLILTAYDVDAAISVAEMAKSEGVDVIAFDRLMTGTDAVDYFLTFNCISLGESMGYYLVEQAERDGGEGLNLYIYSGALTDRNAFEYFRGYWNALQPKIADGTFIVQNSEAAMKYKDVPEPSDEQLYEIMLPMDTQWNPEKAKTLAEADLTNAKPEEKKRAYILAPNDDVGRAIADAFVADSGVEYFRMSGMDGSAASVQYIIDGKQDMTAYGDINELCRTTLFLANDLINGENPTGNETTYNGVKEVESFILGVKTVTRDNLVENFFDSGKFDRANYTNYENISNSVKPENYNRGK